jgi:hypothetical protein
MVVAPKVVWLKVGLPALALLMVRAAGLVGRATLQAAPAEAGLGPPRRLTLRLDPSSFRTVLWKRGAPRSSICASRHFIREAAL